MPWQYGWSTARPQLFALTEAAGTEREKRKNQGEHTWKWQSPGGSGAPGGGPTWMEEHPRLLFTAELGLRE